MPKENTYRCEIGKSTIVVEVSYCNRVTLNGVQTWLNHIACIPMSSTAQTFILYIMKGVCSDCWLIYMTRQRKLRAST